jgi:hypothetical protein
MLRVLFFIVALLVNTTTAFADQRGNGGDNFDFKIVQIKNDLEKNLHSILNQPSFIHPVVSAWLDDNYEQRGVRRKIIMYEILRAVKYITQEAPCIDEIFQDRSICYIEKDNSIHFQISAWQKEDDYEIKKGILKVIIYYLGVSDEEFLNFIISDLLEVKNPIEIKKIQTISAFDLNREMSLSLLAMYRNSEVNSMFEFRRNPIVEENDDLSWLSTKMTIDSNQNWQVRTGVTFTFFGGFTSFSEDQHTHLIPTLSLINGMGLSLNAKKNQDITIYQLHPFNLNFGHFGVINKNMLFAIDLATGLGFGWTSLDEKAFKGAFGINSAVDARISYLFENNLVIGLQYLGDLSYTVGSRALLEQNLRVHIQVPPSYNAGFFIGVEILKNKKFHALTPQIGLQLRF